MQTERVTYLTNADQKAALEAFAKERGASVGSVLREASVKYMAEADMTEQDRFKLLINKLNDALPHIHRSLDSAIEGQRQLRADISRMLTEAGLA